MTLNLTNPHSVLEALKLRPSAVLEVHASRGRGSAAWKDVIDLAERHRIPIREPRPHAARAPRRNDEGGRIGTTYAVVRERESQPLDELFADPTPRGLWLALDQLQDPHNVGAVFRTAAFFGVNGIVLTQHRSASLSATVYDVASGGLEHVPFSLQTNLSRAMEIAKQHEMWVLGSSEHASQDVRAVDRDRRWLLVIGNEEKGLRRLTLENCDELCGIPPRGSVSSLNVSVATGILISALSGENSAQPRRPPKT